MNDDLEQLRADAERYRYLRDVLGLRFKLPGRPLACTAGETDAAIDADRQRSPVSLTHVSCRVIPGDTL